MFFILPSDWPKLLGSSSWSPDNNRLCRPNFSCTSRRLSSSPICSCCSSGNCSSSSCSSSRSDHPSRNSTPRSPTGPSATSLCSCSPCTSSHPCASASCPARPAGGRQHGRLHWAAGRSSTRWPAGYSTKRPTGDCKSSASGFAVGTATSAATVHAGTNLVTF